MSSAYSWLKDKVGSQSALGRLFLQTSSGARGRQARRSRDEGDLRQDGEDDEDPVEEIDDDDDEDLLEETPLLPLFSAAHLDSLPVYNLTHSIRLLILQRCETTLSWEQLRSPQISQFLVKPVQSQIRASHFSRATLYSLLVNCLQFYKEGQLYPGNVGVSNTRALIAELLAIRLLKEFSTRELIDALSYDFDPLSGITPIGSRLEESRPQAGFNKEFGHLPRLARISALEVAIKAPAKRFLAHPLVVTHLEAIWAGTIVFHSAQDSLHRYPGKPPLNYFRHYGAMHGASNNRNSSPGAPGIQDLPIRRSVTLYDPKNASICKLSRLRVPRYRQLFSTLSYAIMLGLFLAVLIERSLDISALEVIFCFWSAGYILDEIVGFSEQGFSLYIMSVWNAFDIGILLLLLMYYLLRLYGIIIAVDQKERIANVAYDILSTSAVLLFPRLFSLLDHYRYFSQLLIAFRLMAQDLAAILVLIAISCSGFVVAFTVAFRSDDSGPSTVVYELFQILMGYTPAAWLKWDHYNAMGKAIMTLFMIIGHFLVVTILITVLTNSFMAIVKNANEEHQFLFAVNTISMVKSDALFSYIAPTNIIGWVFTPIRYFVPFRQFVKVNRSVIKVTHFPILITIFAYERLWRLHFSNSDLEDLVNPDGQSKKAMPTFAGAHQQDLFHQDVRVREPSRATYHKDRALDEVFRRPFPGDTTTTRKRDDTPDRRMTVVDAWMNNMGNEGGASPPQEQAASIVDRLETRRPRVRRSMTSQTMQKNRGYSSLSRSMFSDQDERQEDDAPRRPMLNVRAFDLKKHTEAVDTDGDDELASNEDEGELRKRNSSDKENRGRSGDGPSLLSTNRGAPRSSALPVSPRLAAQPTQLDTIPGSLTGSLENYERHLRGHDRQSSTNTVLFKPTAAAQNDRPSPPSRKNAQNIGDSTRHGELSPQRQWAVHEQRNSVAQPRPAFANRNSQPIVPSIGNVLDGAGTGRNARRASSFDTMALDLASEIGDNRPVVPNEIDPNYFSAYPGSFHTQMAYAQSAMRKRRSDEESTMMSRLMLSRMQTIEEGFKDILKEVKEIKSAASSRGTSGGEDNYPSRRAVRRARKAQQPAAQVPKASSSDAPKESDD